LNQQKEQEVQEIQPGQCRDKGEKIYEPVADTVYWPKNRHWESIKDIPNSTALSIHDPITRYRNLYLNGGGRSGKTTRAIKIFKDINIVVFTHTNALAKDFQNDCKAKDERKQNCLVLIPGSSEKKGARNDIKASQCIWIIDENLVWDNLIYLAIGRVEYLSQLIQIEGPSLPPEIEAAKNKKAIERSLRLFIFEKLVGYMDQDKKKGRKFNLSVDYILVLKDLQKNK
ncbi:25570_t:CDS:2, partial [Gigaspora rosea]